MIGGPTAIIHLFVESEPKSNSSPFLTQKMTIMVKVSATIGSWGPEMDHSRRNKLDTNPCHKIHVF